jgi:hypothetical protein
MLENFSRHGLIDIKLKAKGDTHIDQHHLIEDLGISLGQAIEFSARRIYSSLPGKILLKNGYINFTGNFGKP